MLSSFCSPLNSMPDIPGIISVVTAGIILVVGIISVVIGGHFGGGDHFHGGDHFGGGWSPLWVLPKFLVIPPFGFSVMTDPPFVLLKIKWSHQNPPPLPQAINNDGSPRNEKGIGAQMPAGCSCFRDRCWGLAGQLLGIFSLFLVIVPTTAPPPSPFLRWRICHWAIYAHEEHQSYYLKHRRAGWSLLRISCTNNGNEANDVSSEESVFW